MKQDASIALFAPFGQKLTETFAHVAKLNSELDRALEKERNGYNKSNPSKSSRIQVALVMLHIELKGA